MDEQELDRAIADAALRLAQAATQRERQDAWQELVELHQNRSAEQVARMERERGLR